MEVPNKENIEILEIICININVTIEEVIDTSEVLNTDD
jgi:hypothetical protein